MDEQLKHGQDINGLERQGGGLFKYIEELHSQIKRWTWRGRPTRKVRRLYALERKAGVLGEYSMRQIERLEARILKH